MESIKKNIHTQKHLAYIPPPFTKNSVSSSLNCCLNILFLFIRKS